MGSCPSGIKWISSDVEAVYAHSHYKGGLLGWATEIPCTK